MWNTSLSCHTNDSNVKCLHWHSFEIKMKHLKGLICDKMNPCHSKMVWGVTLASFYSRWKWVLSLSHWGISLLLTICSNFVNTWGRIRTCNASSCHTNDDNVKRMHWDLMRHHATQMIVMSSVYIDIYLMSNG